MQLRYILEKNEGKGKCTNMKKVLLVFWRMVYRIRIFINQGNLPLKFEHNRFRRFGGVWEQTNKQTDRDNDILLLYLKEPRYDFNFE